MADYDKVEISKDPAEYLYGPTGNVASRGTGGTTRDGHVQIVQTGEEVRTQQTSLSEADTGTGGTST